MHNNNRRCTSRMQLLLALCLLLMSPLIIAAEPQYMPSDPDLCLGCHGQGSAKPAVAVMQTPHGNRNNPAAPLGQHGCQSCHGPSAQHMMRGADGKPNHPTTRFGKDQPVAPQNAVCLGCHKGGERGHWQGSPHEFEGLACGSCHTVHAKKDPVLLKSSQTNVCFTCHQDKRAETMKSSAHPILEGSMGCSDCHNPHGTTGPKLLKKVEVNDTCFQCHAEKRGPFLWEHAPVSESCTNCHNPHGSQHKPMLTAATPWLCQQCHMASFHPSTAYSGDGVPPNGAAQQLLYRNCMNCHTQVHGSNHPSGPRFTR